MYHYDEFCGMWVGEDLLFDRVDWVDEHCSKRTRQEYPYSYDAHYTFRDFDKKKQPEGLDAVYSDRMRYWDPDAFEKACKAVKKGWLENLTKSEAKKFIEVYYAGKYKCLGHAACCNVSSGYGIGLFFIVPEEKTTRRKKAD